MASKDSSNLVEKKYALQNTVGILEQERQLEIEAAKTAYQNKIRTYILSGGLGVILLIMFLLYRNNRQKHRSNKILESTLENLRSTQAQLIQSEKMASLGELTAGIGHEIKNPINFINNFSDLAIELLVELRSGPMNELPTHRKEEAIELINEAIQSLHKVVHHGKRADGIVKSMLQHASQHRT
jgi:C4-dicarboxylate-specific signal transduction histidine kinase